MVRNEIETIGVENEIETSVYVLAILLLCVAKTDGQGYKDVPLKIIKIINVQIYL